MKIIKKYSNRRLYDTDQSQYITLEELAESIRAGHDVRVVDAKSGDDLTQATLAQIVVESRGAAKLLPVPLLLQMIRMGDDALAEFMSLYMSWALEVYIHVRRGVSGYNPFGGGFSFNPASALQRLFSFGAPWAEGAMGGGGFPAPPTPPAPGRGKAKQVAQPGAEDSDVSADDMALLRREINELKERLNTLDEASEEEEKPAGKRGKRSKR